MTAPREPVCPRGFTCSEDFACCETPREPRAERPTTYRNPGPCKRHKTNGCLSCDERLPAPSRATQPTAPGATTCPNGHPAGAIVTSDEGTSFCRVCEREATEPAGFEPPAVEERTVTGRAEPENVSPIPWEPAGEGVRSWLEQARDALNNESNILAATSYINAALAALKGADHE